MASNKAVEVARGLVGAVLGGVAGYYAYFWMLEEGFFGPSIPGLMVGAVSGGFAKSRSTIRGVLCGLAGLALGIFVYWQSLVNPPSLPYFVAHLHRSGYRTLILLAIGGIGGYWFGRDTILFGGKKKRKKGAYARVEPEDLEAPTDPPTIKP